MLGFSGLRLSGFKSFVEPTELVISVRCGTPLVEVEALLRQRSQMLAFEPPHFAGAPTLGGVVAAGLAGPRRMSAGAVRDFVLGISLLDGRGEHLRFGGQVMKNVAGYDVSRMLTGSLGCLGVITDISLKVLPLPRREITLQFALTQAEALEQLNGWAGQPLPISASLWFDGLLSLRLSGAEAAVAAASIKLGGQELAPDDADRLWRSLRDQTHAFFAPTDSGLLRLSLPDSAPPLELDTAPLIEWGGAQRWCRIAVDRLDSLRQRALQAGGHATLFRAPPGQSVDQVFTPLAPALQRIHLALKHSFDPAGIFNRGHMYPEF